MLGGARRLPWQGSAECGLTRDRSRLQLGDRAEPHLLRQKLRQRKYPVPLERQSRSRKHRRAPFPVRIDGQWYDLAAWRDRHPGGTQFINCYEGKDATEVMHAFHSIEARRRFSQLPKLSKAMADQMERGLPPTSEVTRNFRDLRGRLEREGWWDRDLGEEASLLSIWGALFLGGLALAHLPGWGAGLAIPPLALAAVQGAWIGHDYVHGVDEFSARMRLFGSLAIGISPTWWSDKHTKHHAMTNQMGADSDISMAPLYIWPPHPHDDSPFFRRTQHLWLPLGYMSVFPSWCFRGLVWAARAAQRGRPGTALELAALITHWAVILTNVPAPVLLGYWALAGIGVGTIVTSNHICEELHSEFQHDWVSAQFRSTRDAVTRGPFTEWLWGGMQYQLAHHLFPSMPRSRYPELVPALRRFAEENAIPGGYRADDEVDMVVKTWEKLRDIAGQPSGDRSAPRLNDGTFPPGEVSAAYQLQLWADELFKT